MERNLPSTIEEIEAIDRNTLTTAEAAYFLGMGQQTLNCAAKAGTLPFACKAGARTIIPKQAFIHYLRYGQVTTASTKSTIPLGGGER